MSYRGRINQYTCQKCGSVITTIDIDEGTTPMMLPCQVTNKCKGWMRSGFYLVDQHLTPDHEWYKPVELPMHRAEREHVQMGGLLIRKVEG